MQNNRIRSTLLALLLILFFPLGDVLGDGCFFREKKMPVGNSAESPNQRAFIIFDKNRETLIVQVKYQGEATDFSWVLPVPSIPEEGSIETVSDSIFTLLHEQSQPKLYIYSKGKYSEERGLPVTDNMNNEIYEATEINVWQNLQVGPYKIYVISSLSNEALINWLSDNGYDFPADAQHIIDYYTQKKWYFVAVQVNVTSQLTKNSSNYQAGLPAIKMTFKAEKPVFPLRISELTSAPENEIELYVAARHRVICDGYQTASLNYEEVEQVVIDNYYANDAGSSGISCACDRILAPQKELAMDYEEFFRLKVNAYTDPTFFVEHAAPDYGSYRYGNYVADLLNETEEFWITRLRTILRPSGMRQDVFFKDDPAGDNDFVLRFWLEESQPNPWSYSFYVTPSFLMLPIFFSRRIRRNYGKHLALLTILQFMAI